MGKMTKNIMFTFFITIMWCFSTANTFVFKEVQTENLCVEQLLCNVEKVSGIYMSDVKYHYVSLKIEGTDTLFEIHSHDLTGSFDYLSKKTILGICQISDGKFFIDQSLSSFFRETGRNIKIKYGHKLMQVIHQISCNDAYIYWLFKKKELGIELYRPWNKDVFQYWYDLELDTNCFETHRYSIDFIEEETEDFED